MNFSEAIFWGNQNDTLNSTLHVSQNITVDRVNEETYKKMKLVIDSLILITVLVIMLGMGCDIKIKQLLDHIKKPVGICTGMFAQFVIMPLSAFILLSCTSTSGVQAATILIIACCPGGTFSNFLVYFCDGDISLSATMTSLSTLLAMGAMPLNLWLYGQNFQADDVVIPHGKLAFALFCTTCPVALGMLVKRKFSRFAFYFAKACWYFAFPTGVVALTIQLIFTPNVFSSFPAKLYAVIISLPAIGFSLAYGVTMAFRLSAGVRRTIGIECGMQNITTALAVLALTFPRELLDEMIPIPCIYAFASLIGGIIFCCFYQVLKKCVVRKSAVQETNLKEMNGGKGMMKKQDSDAKEPMLPGDLEATAVKITHSEK